MRKIAFTTTIPQEYIWASGAVPVDLNNLFITKNAKEFIKSGEKHGVPRNTCSWIKGLMGVVAEHKDQLEAVIAVTEGDCSNNHGLINLYKYYFPELKVISFAYPSDRDENKLKYELDKLGEFLDASYSQAMQIKEQLDVVRRKLAYLDKLYFEKNNIPASDFQKLMVASSDFGSDLVVYTNRLEAFIEKAEQEDAKTDCVMIGYVGVPTIISDLFSYLEDELGIKVAYFEVENDFAMLNESIDIIEEYQKFNYPYDLSARVKEIGAQVKRRNLKGIIHYVQSFCHRQLDDVIIHNSLNVPVLTIEGDAPGVLDMRTKIRIECFIERLKENR